MSHLRLVLGHQLGHLLWLLALLFGLFGLGRLPGFWDGEFLGLATRSWVYLCVANAVVHQAFVWICWRTELYGQLLTRTLEDAAFYAYAAIFTVLILARPLLVTVLALSNAGSFAASQPLMWALAILLLAPSLYLIHSVRRYFGFKRAFGIDHFDASHRDRPLVRGGIFRFSSNAMYVFGFLILWVPGLLLQSTAAIAVALFSHLYIWVHYFFTEKPDMQYIYARGGKEVNAN